ncbi:hypothetical protein JTB14_038490 [Gonioctena quinquepunctata]|nr:hypothetical protein JTB14_038490 [Gonioctena quinquepunctata]
MIEKIRRSTVWGEGLVIPGLALFVLGNCGPNDYKTAVSALIVAGSVSSACLSGHMINHMDLSPNHSGTLMGLANQVAVSAIALEPIFMQYLVTNEVG